MTVQPFILYDPEECIEIVFEEVLEDIEKSFTNEVTNFRRYSDGQHETFTSMQGSREITVTVMTSDPSGLRRTLDYLRRDKGAKGLGKHLFLFLSTFDFVSEVIIKNVRFVCSVGPQYPVEITFTCFGPLGQMRTALDARCSGIGETADTDAIEGYASVLDAQNEYLRFVVTAGHTDMDVGDYTILARAKSTGSIGSDLTVRAYDATASSAVITAAHTPTIGEYLYYLSEGSIGSSQAGHTMQIEARKATTSSNAISVDLLAYVPSSQNAIISAPSGTTTIELSPTYDNRMRSAAATTVDGSAVYNDIGGSGSNPIRPILIFDLSSIPSGATITSATLSLYWYYPAGATRTNSTVVGVYRPRYSWNPSYVCWDNRASGTAWANAGGDWYDSTGTSQGSTPFASATFAAATVPDNSFHTWDVKTLVQAYVNGTYSNYGFLLKASVENSNYIAFYSREYSSASMRPKLTVSYEV